LPLLLACAPCQALGQTLDAQDEAPPSPAPTLDLTPPTIEEPAEVAFSADQLVYEETSDTVTASGEVRMTREGYRLRADSVSWDRRSGEVRANGDVRIVSPEGDTAYADSVQLEDTLKDGVVQNMLLVLADGGRLAATEARRVHGYLTYGSRLQLDPLASPALSEDKGIRGYIEGSGRFILSPDWSVTFSGRYATDRTFMRRYDISRDDRLRSVADFERITVDSYVSIAGWAFEGLRLTDVAGTQPIALPAIDARWRIA